MNKNELKLVWLKEEEVAHIKGWDFSHIQDKYEEGNDLPWDYEQIIRQYLNGSGFHFSEITSETASYVDTPRFAVKYRDDARHMITIAMISRTARKPIPASGNVFSRN